jgi:hypothetical protein
MWSLKDAQAVLDRLDEINARLPKESQINIIHGYAYELTQFGLNHLISHWDTAPGYGTSYERKIIDDVAADDFTDPYIHFLFFVGAPKSVDSGFNFEPQRRPIPILTITFALLALTWLAYRCAST